MFKKWTSIDKFSDVVKNAQRIGISNVTFVGKVKLHGTNAAIRIENGETFFQKRSQDITPMSDNFGFANWASRVDFGREDKIIYGEWAGNGINNRDAVTQLKTKKFFVFAVDIDNKRIYDPAIIRQHVPIHDDIFIIPQEFQIEVDIFKSESLRQAADFLNEKISKIDEEDHYVKELFGISGPGEGYVLNPIVIGDKIVDDEETYNALTFKVKTESHSVNKIKGTTFKVEIPPSTVEFVEIFATVQRFEQMYSESFGEDYSMKNTPIFIKAVIEDIIKESVNEREESGVEIKDANKLISAKAVSWLKGKCNGM